MRRQWVAALAVKLLPPLRGSTSVRHPSRELTLTANRYRRFATPIADEHLPHSS